MSKMKKIRGRGKFDHIGAQNMTTPLLSEVNYLKIEKRNLVFIFFHRNPE